MDLLLTAPKIDAFYLYDVVHSIVSYFYFYLDLCLGMLSSWVQY